MLEATTTFTDKKTQPRPAAEEDCEMLSPLYSDVNIPNTGVIDGQSIHMCIATNYHNLRYVVD